MIWYKINDRWWIDILQVRAFGIPMDRKECICIVFKDENKHYYAVDNPENELKRFEEFQRSYFNSYNPIINEGELPYGLV